MTATAIQNIAAKLLVASATNVRKRASTRDDELYASIRERGVLQNIVVSSVKKPKGHFEVIAGGRRLRTIQKLIEDGVFTADYQVPCLVIDANQDGAEISLQENFQREDMNPADQCLAFQKIAETGATPDEIARRFGVTTRFVQGRLKLTALSPVIFEALAEGEISLDVAQAFTLRTEHDFQEAVYARCNRMYNSLTAEYVRSKMTADTVAGTNSVALFVGRDAYVAAGGAILSDLFSDAANERWTNPEILEPLIEEKLATEAERLRDELGVREVIIYPEAYVPWNASTNYQQLPTTSREPTEEEATELAELRAYIEEYDEYEAESEDEAVRITQEIDDRLQKIEQIEDALEYVDQDQRASATMFGYLSREGVVQLAQKYYIPRDNAKPKGLDNTNNSNDEAGEPDDDKLTLRPLAANLIGELAAQRTDVLRLYIASNPAMAIDITAFLIANGTMLSGFSIRMGEHSGPRAEPLPAYAELIESLNNSWQAGKNDVEKFDLFRQMPDEDRLAWLAFGTARAAISDVSPSKLQRHIASLLEVDVPGQWRPTEENYWSRISRAHIFDAFDLVGGEELRHRYDGSKKGILAQTADGIFSGNSVSIEPEIAQRAVTWVPEIMLFDKPNSDSDDDFADGPDDEDENPEDDLDADIEPGEQQPDIAPDVNDQDIAA